MNHHPTGTITFLLTDLEGSTKLWEAQPEAMRVAVARHDALLRQAVTSNNGYLFKTTGDGIAAAFAVASDGLAAALAAQISLGAEPWPEAAMLRSRMGLHTGAAELRDGDYFGSTLNRAARLMAAGHGGQTLLSDATKELSQDSLPPAVLLLPLGEHRLKDLTRPEMVYQLSYFALAVEFPPLRTLDNPDFPNNLPLQLTSFVGREKPLADVSELLAKTRLLTLTGAGGSGKTRLSLQAAADALDVYADGVWLVELAALSDPALVPQTVASVVGVTEQAGKSLTQTLIENVKAKRVLLLLDNAEHLLQSCAVLVTALLRACPEIKVLVTSREPLGVGGETAYRVPTLTLPGAAQAAAATADSLRQFEAVQLFIERAQSVKTDFKMTNANAPALAQLCNRLDGIPLAIELAAARVRSLAVEQINDKLDGRFRLLTGGDRSAMPRQQTLRALIDWSFDLLTESEKALLARLSIFAGGWVLAGAEAVSAGDSTSPGSDPIEDWEILDLLTSLADKSLVQVEESEGASRFRMLETVRQYALEKLSASGEGAVIQARHWTFFLALAREAAPKLAGPEQVTWLNCLETEHDNFRAALDACATRSSSTSGAETDIQTDTDEAAAVQGLSASSGLLGLRLAGALGRFWDVRGYLSEGREHLARALEGYQTRQTKRGVMTGAGSEIRQAGGETEVKIVVAEALKAAGILAMHQGDFTSARSLCEESLVLYRVAGDRNGIGNALMNLGTVAHAQGDLETTLSLYEESIVLYRETGHKSGIAAALTNLGTVAFVQGGYAAARSFYKESLVLYRVVGDKNGIGTALTNLGAAAYAQGDCAAARLLYEKGLALLREVGDKNGICNALLNLGTVAYAQGDCAAARLLYVESLVLNRETGNRTGAANALSNLGCVACKQGNYADAGALIAESLVFFREIGARGAITAGLEGMAAVIRSKGNKGDRGQAATLWGAASALHESLGEPLSPPQQAEVDAGVALARTEMGEGAFTSAWDEGRVMTWEKAVELALAAVDTLSRADEQD